MCLNSSLNTSPSYSFASDSHDTLSSNITSDVICLYDAGDKVVDNNKQNYNVD